MVNRYVLTGAASALTGKESADTMEQLLQESQLRMGISQNSRKGQCRKTLMDVLNVDMPARFVDDSDLKIMNQDALK